MTSHHLRWPAHRCFSRLQQPQTQNPTPIPRNPTSKIILVLHIPPLTHHLGRLGRRQQTNHKPQAGRWRRTFGTWSAISSPRAFPSSKNPNATSRDSEGTRVTLSPRQTVMTMVTTLPSLSVISSSRHSCGRYIIAFLFRESRN
jgi:hypothetical protein